MMQPENRHEINNLSRPPEIKAARENQQQQEHQISHCMMHNTKASRQKAKTNSGEVPLRAADETCSGRDFHHAMPYESHQQSNKLNSTWLLVTSKNHGRERWG